jgi:transcriptional regulator with XRE-family HTH domain
MRLKDGYSVAAFARDLGMTPSHVSNIEAGRRGASPAVIKRMATLLAVPISALVENPERVA